MKTPKITSPVVIDDDFLHATDDEGNVIPDDDIIAEAEAVETLKFKFQRGNHIIQVRAIQVPARLTNRLGQIGSRLALQAGYRPGDQIGGDLEPQGNDGQGNEAQRENAEAEAPQTDERLTKLIQLTDESEELRQVHAEIAVAAIVRDEQGIFQISYPPFREKLTAQKLLSSGALGDAVIIAVRDWLRPT